MYQQEDMETGDGYLVNLRPKYSWMRISFYLWNSSLSHREGMTKGKSTGKNPYTGLIQCRRIKRRKMYNKNRPIVGLTPKTFRELNRTQCQHPDVEEAQTNRAHLDMNLA